MGYTIEIDNPLQEQLVRHGVASGEQSMGLDCWQEPEISGYLISLGDESARLDRLLMRRCAAALARAEVISEPEIDPESGDAVGERPIDHVCRIMQDTGLAWK